jgi:RNA polymerase sigma factor (sigma-70 family)
MGVHPIHAALTTEYVQKLITIKARQISKCPGFRLSEQEDLEQDLATHVLKRAHLFDPARGSANTFIARVVESAAAMVQRDRRRKKRVVERRMLSLEGPAYPGGSRNYTLRETIDEGDLRRHRGGEALSACEAQTLSADFASALGSLPPALQDVAIRLADGNEHSVARALGVSRRQLRKAVAAVQEHFRSKGLAEIPR